MNTDHTPLLPHGGYRKLRGYPDEIRRYEDSGRRNFSLRASGSSTGICPAIRIIARHSARMRNGTKKNQMFSLTLRNRTGI